MGFNSVYRSLTEIFPQIDARMLRAVAIEHPKDADEAAAVVLSEIVPSLPSNSRQNSTQAWNKSSGSISERGERDLEDGVSRCRGFLVASGSKSSASSSSETIPLVVARGCHDARAPSTYLVSDRNELTNLPLNGGSGVYHKDVESEEVQSLKRARGKEHKNYDLFGKRFDVPSEAKIGLHLPEHDLNFKPTSDFWKDLDLNQAESSTSMVSESAVQKLVDLTPGENDLASVVSAVAQNNVKPTNDFDLNQAESSTNIGSENAEEKLVDLTPGNHTSEAKTGLHMPVHDLLSVVSTPAQENFLLSSDFWKDLYLNRAESSTSIVSENAEQKWVDLTPEDLMNILQQSSRSEYGTGSTNLVEETSESLLANESGDTELDRSFNSSTHGSSIDHLEEIIEDAKSKKKTLFTVMESVMNLMKEVELQEKDVEKSKEEAASGGVDTLEKVEELKKMLEHAKEANDMHAGEVYGEKSILATEVKELENRLLNLSEERNKSLAALNEMRETLEIRLMEALEMKKAAEKEKKEKEDFALKALAEQEAIMEQIDQESKLLQQEAEENSKLREFLMDRGQVIDSLQGEISVIYQDVKVLKEKFENRVSLTKSISSSQTSSSGSSSSERFDEAAASLMNEDDCRELVEDGWEIFDKEIEL